MNGATATGESGTSDCVKNARRLRRTLVWMSLAAAVAAPAVADDTARPFALYEFRYRVGDDPRWAEPAWNDSSWEQVRLWDVEGVNGVFWLRRTFELEARRIPAHEPFGVLFSGLATIEIYWDGQRLPTAGRVGATRDEEDPGPLYQVVYVPQDLATAGTHVLALRLSDTRRGFDAFTGLWEVTLGPYLALADPGAWFGWVPLMSLSGMVVVGTYFLVLFFLDRRERSHLWLGLLCAASAALLVTETSRSLIVYTYDWHLVRLRIVTALSYAVNLLLIVFLTARFPLPGRRIARIAVALAMVVPMFAFQAWDPKGFGIFAIGFAAALVWSLYAVLRRLTGSVFVLVGVAACVVIQAIAPYRFQDLTFFLSLDLLLVALLIAHARQIRTAQRERELAMLRSARLEAELLRKHIQPHFLMNTLTALCDWIEEDPRVASRLIHALADEFRALSAVADRTLVPLRDEVRLCRSHLEVMGLRRGRDYRLRTAGLDEDLAVPPAVFHTLVENAITHGGGDGLEMRLTQVREGANVRFTFEAPLARNAGTADGDAAGEGTGVRYVRARLREAFGTRWSFTGGAAGDVYRTEIVMPAGA